MKQSRSFRVCGLILRMLSPSLAGYALALSAQVSPPWMNTALTPDQRTALLMAQMALDEKITMLHGVNGSYHGNVAGNTRLAIPTFTFMDGPAGVGNALSQVTALPAPIALAASWDTDLARQYGTIIGEESHGKGIHVILGPMMNLQRVPQGGRNFEGFGEDPFLSSAIAAADIQGIQSQGVIATAKHFVCNDQETNRTTENSVVDERTLQEIYYAPFRASARAGVGAVMGSYNRLNGWPMCQAPQLGTVLKAMSGFGGFIMCDWGAGFAGQVAANNGLDLEMPAATRFATALATNVQTGAVAPAQVDEMARRILTAMFRFGIFDNPAAGNLTSNVATPAHSQFARDSAAQAIVLLRNAASLLPLNPATIHSIAVIGSAANNSVISTGTGSAQVNLPYNIQPFNAIAIRAGLGVTVLYSQGDGGHIPQAVQLARASDVAVVCVGEQTGEGTDRASLGLPGDQDALVSAVAAANPRTIVVLYADAATVMPWIAQVAAALVAWYPGQENGNALASVLFGDVNPSGKLPVTFPATTNQVPANTPAQYPGLSNQVNYSERLLMGYRWYDASNVPPLFPFGHGLSYTTFAYSNLTVGAVTPSGQVAVGLDLQNTGNRTGAEVAQLYLGFPANAGEPPRQLKGFRKVLLPPGTSPHLNFTLNWEDLACWDATFHQWTVPLGTFQVMVGSSSRDIRLTGAFSVLSPIPSSGLANGALYQPVIASSVLNSNSPGTAAVDGNPATHWSSLPGGIQSLTVDLGSIKPLTRIRLTWDLDFARNYQILVSSDSNHWSNAFTTTNGAGGIEDFLVGGSARYVQLYPTQSGTGAGYSLQELEIYSPEVQLVPRLTMTRTTTNTLVATWPANWGGATMQQNTHLNWSNFVLQQTSGDPTTGIWATTPGNSTVLSGTNRQILPKPATNQFYRLQSP
jgi:beta-glucosidase